LAAAAVFSLIGHLNTAYAADRVIVLDSGESELSLIDETTHKVVGTEPTGKEPHHLMITPDGKSLIVADSVSNNLMFIDPHTGEVQRTVDGIEDPYQLGFSPDHKWFVTAALRMDRADIYHYDGTNMTLVKHIPLAKTPSHMTFGSDNRTVFMTLQDSGELAAIDLPTQTVLWKMHVGNEPAGLWMTPGDKYLLVGMTGEDDVAVVDWRKQQIVKKIHTGRGGLESRRKHHQHHRLHHAHQRRRHHRPDARTGRHGTYSGQALSMGGVPLCEARRRHRPDDAQADRHHCGGPFAARHLFRQPCAGHCAEPRLNRLAVASLA